MRNHQSNMKDHQDFDQYCKSWILMDFVCVYIYIKIILYYIIYYIYIYTLYYIILYYIILYYIILYYIISYYIIYTIHCTWIVCSKMSNGRMGACCGITCSWDWDRPVGLRWTAVVPSSSTAAFAKVGHCKWWNLQHITDVPIINMLCMLCVNMYLVIQCDSLLIHSKSCESTLCKNGH